MLSEQPSWNPEEYLKFERERTLPCRDLVRRVELNAPVLIVDLGCGPGNSTSVLAERWPAAKIVGVDSSPEMLAKARVSSIRAQWVLADIHDWKSEGRYDLIFSNAVLHWVARQRGELPRLFNLLASGGALAFQIPTKSGAWRRAITEITHMGRWRNRFLKEDLKLHSGSPSFYYDLFSPISARVDLWETEYIHILPNVEAIVEWTKSSAAASNTGSTPKGGNPSLPRRLYKLAGAYRKRPDGRVLFPFRRLFVVAYRRSFNLH